MYATPPRDRLISGAAALAVTAALGWGLIAGLAGDAARRAAEETLALFQVAPPPPSPPPVRPEPRQRVVPREEGRAAPPNRVSKATPVAAPTPIVVVPLPPPPIVTAPKPFAGSEATQGAARPGPGTGAGGEGDGTGSGGWGDGDGGGGGAETPPRWRGGRLKYSDYPGEEPQGVVHVKFLVWIDGRVRDCQVTRSSGNRLLDATTCRLIQQRFRYAPSRDARGRAVPAYIVEKHSWEVEDVPAEE